jgi:hypothetical protein
MEQLRPVLPEMMERGEIETVLSFGKLEKVLRSQHFDNTAKIDIIRERAKDLYHALQPSAELREKAADDVAAAEQRLRKLLSHFLSDNSTLVNEIIQEIHAATGDMREDLRRDEENI